MPTARADTHLILSSGTRDRTDLRARALRWAAHWRNGDKPWRWRFFEIDGDTHAANAPDAYRAGMRTIFGWKPN